MILGRRAEGAVQAEGGGRGRGRGGRGRGQGRRGGQGRPECQRPPERQDEEAEESPPKDLTPYPKRDSSEVSCRGVPFQGLLRGSPSAWCLVGPPREEARGGQGRG